MSLYRKRFPVVSAFQVTKESRINRGQWPKWLSSAYEENWSDKPNRVQPLYLGEVEGRLAVKGIHDTQMVEWGDWILMDNDGDFSVCSDKDFSRNYERVNPIPDCGGM